jgi:hypothetical protein
MIGRILAWLVFLCAVAVAGRDGLVFLESGAYSPLTLDDIWGAIAPASLRSARDAAALLLRGPAWAVLTGLAIVVALLFGRHHRRKWRSGSLN